ncbi:MAG: hypothetical protein BZ138_06805, partial [Methanosphaera sp. rholeuAM270]
MKTATTVTTADQITGQKSGDYILDADIDLGSGRITINGAFTLDGAGHSITRNANGASIIAQNRKTDLIIFKNVIFDEMGTGATLYFVNCTNVIIENCTFINCAKGDGVIEARTNSSLIVKDTKFYDIKPGIYVSPQPFQNSAKATISVCELYFNEEPVKTKDFSVGSSYVVMTSTHAESLFLYLDVDDTFEDITQDFRMILGNQVSGSNGNIFAPITGPLSYKIMNSEGTVLDQGSKNNAQGSYDFSYTFDQKGKYFLYYAFDGQGNYKAVDGTKTIIVYETSVLVDPQIISISETDGIDVQVTLKNSTDSAITGAPVVLTVNGHDY